MLNVQVQYWTLQENKRHNLASEHHNTQVLAETARANRVSEGIAQQNADSARINAKAAAEMVNVGYANAAASQTHANAAYLQAQTSQDLAASQKYSNYVTSTSRAVDTLVRGADTIAKYLSGAKVASNSADQALIAAQQIFKE